MSGDEVLATILHKALQRQAAGSKCKDLAAHIAIVEELVHAQVCTRCILRILRHAAWDDYCVEQLDHSIMLQSLRKAAGLQSANAVPGCVTEGQPVHGSAASSGEGMEVTLSRAGPNDASVDTTDVTVNDTSASSTVAQPTAPCTLCLGLLQRLESRQSSAPPGPSTPSEGRFDSRAVPWLSPKALCDIMKAADVDFATFAIDVNLPISIILRDRILTEHLSAKYGWMGLFRGNSDQLLSLKMVLRRVLGPQMVQHLGAGKKLLDGGTDVTLSLTLDDPQAMLEVRPLLEDHIAFQQQKREIRTQPHLSNRQRKKLRQAAYSAAAPASQPDAMDLDAGQLQEADEQADTNIQQEMGSTATASPEPHDVQAATDAMVASISFDKALGQVQSVPSRVFRKLFPWPLKALTQDHMDTCKVNVRLTRASVYLAGRYLKLQRGMPQSRWYDPQTGLRIGYVSVAEQIEEAVLPVFAAEESKFIAGGREDADVRMLGEGRPFVLELIHPQHVSPSKEELIRVERSMAEANHGARVVQLALCTKKAIDKIKEAEESKEKTYSALCWAERPLNPKDVADLLAVKDLAVMQDTPLRVLHRRAPKVRSKKVSIEAVEVVSAKPQYFSINLRTQAGAYVKEFCHGDFGRTQPNLGTFLGCRTEILQLDVTEVHMHDWP